MRTEINLRLVTCSIIYPRWRVRETSNSHLLWVRLAITHCSPAYMVEVIAYSNRPQQNDLGRCHVISFRLTVFGHSLIVCTYLRIRWSIQNFSYGHMDSNQTFANMPNVHRLNEKRLYNFSIFSFIFHLLDFKRLFIDPQINVTWFPVVIRLPMCLRVKFRRIIDNWQFVV